MRPVAIALVVFVFLAAFAGYWVAATDHTTTTAPTPLFSYGETGAFTYVAHLKNNTLYNSTYLTPGNGTLFSAITDWVNVSFTFHLTTNRSVNATSVATIAVLLQSPAWSKPLFSETVRTSVVEGTFATLGAVYDLNVTNVTGLAATIEKETGYVPSAYSVVISPSVRSSIGLGENATGATFVPTLTLNFTANQIVPSRLTSSESAAFTPPGDPSLTNRPNVSVIAFLLLFGAVGGAGAMAYLLYDSRGERPAPDLSTMTRPYQEAIVDARAPPSAPTLVPVRAWEDIVKAADTLGSPIIRVVRPSVAGPEAPTTTSFYVVSGSTAFVFVHSPDSPGGTPPPPDSPARAEAPAPGSLSAAVRDWHERYPRIPGVDTSTLDAFVLWSDRISDRLRWFRPTSSIRQDSEELLLRAIGLAQRGRLDSAWVILGQLYTRLGPWETVGKPPSTGPAGGSASGRPGTPRPAKGTGPKP